MPLHLANRSQSQAILRYHARLVRLGQSSSIEHTARTWIRCYAALWRSHLSR
jgi:hypothetical protein